jgi:hypothetical protein
MPRVRQVITAGGSLVAHAGLLALVAWMLTGEAKEQPSYEPMHIIPIDLPLLPIASSKRHPPEPPQQEDEKDKDAEKAEREKVGASIRWPSVEAQGVSSALHDFTKIDCWPADDETDLDECLSRLARDPSSIVNVA